MKEQEKIGRKRKVLINTEKIIYLKNTFDEYTLLFISYSYNPVISTLQNISGREEYAEIERRMCWGIKVISVVSVRNSVAENFLQA